MKLKRLLFVLPLAGLSAGRVLAQTNGFDCLIEPNQVVELRSPVEGVIEKVLVQRGDRIKAGQALVQLESSVENSALKAARHRSQAEGRMAVARSRFEYAKKKMIRQNELQSAQFIAAQARDEAEAERLVAEAELIDAHESRQLAAYEARQINDQLNRRTLRSPFDGVVMDRYLNPGDLAESGNGRRPVLKIAQVEPLRVEVVLPVSAYGKLGKGETATVVPETLGGRYAAQVSIVDSVFDSASGTFGVRLQLANPDGKLPAGIRCHVEFDRLKGGRAVPVKKSSPP